MSEKPRRRNALWPGPEGCHADMDLDALLKDVPPDRPVLIAGPTASGKSALALALARDGGGVVVNADALQVFANWRILTARPSLSEEEVAPHRLYGHVSGDTAYSVGHWLRDVTPILAGPDRPIIVGGTGLYLTALTEGLAEIPQTPAEIRAEGEALLDRNGLQALLDDLDPETLARIDQRNPARVARAWEVQRTTGHGLASWQDTTPAPLLPLDDVTPICLLPDREWLLSRITRRFDAMIAQGALEEARANLPDWSPTAPSSKAIGARELIAHLRGEMTLENARDSAVVATRQYAKRQMTWFRARMSKWCNFPIPSEHV
ncbi:tRNA (adenosine(37)-N6)-dimethylallyltransferase MiaA [Maritimibacter sp. DP1N21-5]|uniref:tRNA (adenosine(37)-N6)-dimethylallyltransferase MiaA n=1 Tax=Maritimibacter sp. DP1N21-5 TaxID=2836867 RepID=UPI001C4820AF|nr:tRNA (adenosine(37)-N6)-dimethylallyltransferase MiaA [Maritimibacter sp. DP1N21-5]MBV7409784.1 tRNA (adenosine(37)-N6)-dimethylallyltransferase MiaA [Maritimibacter sp. DP1N21-5]